MNITSRIVAVLLIGTAFTASAATFDFEGTTVGTGLTTLTVTDSGLSATITRVGGGTFEIINIGASVPAFGSRTLSPFSGGTTGGGFFVDFSALISGFTVSMGDFSPSDTDTLTLTAYSGAGGTGAVLGTSSLPLVNGSSGFDFLTLSVGSASIASIKMVGGSASFPNSVFYDNMIATTGTGVPDSASTLGLMVVALAAMAAIRRRLPQE